MFRFEKLLAVVLVCCSLVACGGGEGTASAGSSASGAFPQRPIRVIVPFGPGGLADVTMRIAGEEMSVQLGQPLVIENRPGAGGVAATSTLLGANADGHTLIVLTNGTAIAETQFPDLPYDITTDLQPVSAVAWFDIVLLTNPQSGVNSVQSLLDLARSKPGGLRIATINPGSTQHLSAELFKSKAGIEGTVISYRTTPDVLGALLRREVDVAFDAYTALKGPIDSGEALAIAVTGEERNVAMPNVPTVAESGVADYVVTGWNALYAKAGTPQSVIDTLNQAVQTVSSNPALQSRFTELGVVGRASTPAEIQQRLLDDIAKWHDVMVTAKLAAQ